MRTEVMGALIEPLQDIHAGARHVRDNVRESTWLTKFSFVALGCALGLVVGYVPVRSDLNALVEHVNNIDHYLAAQQPPAAAAMPGPGKDHKGKASSRLDRCRRPPGRLWICRASAWNADRSPASHKPTATGDG